MKQQFTDKQWEAIDALTADIVRVVSIEKYSSGLCLIVYREHGNNFDTIKWIGKKGKVTNY